MIFNINSENFNMNYHYKSIIKSNWMFLYHKCLVQQLTGITIVLCVSVHLTICLSVQHFYQTNNLFIKYVYVNEEIKKMCVYWYCHMLKKLFSNVWGFCLMFLYSWIDSKMDFFTFPSAKRLLCFDKIMRSCMNAINKTKKTEKKMPNKVIPMLCGRHKNMTFEWISTLSTMKKIRVRINKTCLWNMNGCPWWQQFSQNLATICKSYILILPHTIPGACDVYEQTLVELTVQVW